MNLPIRELLTVVGLLALAATITRAESPKLQDIPLKDIDGKDATLQAHAGKVLLIVNVASECGHTPQYAGLEALWRKYRDRGLVVLGFPCNDFGEQEPGSNAEIRKFCTSRYEVTFPMFEKIHLKGAEQHPLYRALTGPAAPFPGDVQWNFGKFLVDRTGKVIARYDSDTEPESSTLVDAIEKALNSK
jgi:glutathione peroxidase